MIESVSGVFLLLFFNLVHGQNVTVPPPSASTPVTNAGNFGSVIPNIPNQFCPGRKPGFLGDRCGFDQPCLKDYSLECKFNKCECRKGYIPTRENNGICESAPSLNHACFEQCRAPLVCRDGPISTPSPLSPGIPPRSTPGKTCRCDPPYVLKNGYDCRLECKPDEIYDSDDGKCKGRCKVDEVKLADGTCSKICKLGQACKDSKQCSDEFSWCYADMCKCQGGFDESNGKCIPKKYSCPWAEPVRDQSGQVALCNKTDGSSQNTQQRDSCPTNAFCHGTYYVDSGSTGFCCPKPNFACPIGDALPNATCGSYPSNGQQCPSETHYCHTMTVAGYSDSLCCPKACKNGYIWVNGVCYPKRQYGDACEVNEQCTSSNGVCSDGTCKCPGNAQPTGNGQYCNTACGPDEVRVQSTCHKRLNLGDSCEGKPSSLCPLNAGCDENKKCSCLCSFVPLGNKRCGPYPVCKKHTSSAISPSFSQNALSTGRPITDSPAETIPPNVDNSHSNGNYTFCRLYEDDEPPVQAVRRCPQGQFCNYYQSDFGLCCPIPDPVCPDGSKGTKTCKPGENTCGSGSNCQKYFEAQGGSSPHAGYICCP